MCNAIRLQSIQNGLRTTIRMRLFSKGTILVAVFVSRTAVDVKHRQMFKLHGTQTVMFRKECVLLPFTPFSYYMASRHARHGDTGCFSVVVDMRTLRVALSALFVAELFESAGTELMYGTGCFAVSLYKLGGSAGAAGVNCGASAGATSLTNIGSNSTGANASGSYQRVRCVHTLQLDLQALSSSVLMFTPTDWELLWTTLRDEGQGIMLLN
jgi:hypothetical protein